ncbi:MAG: recombinase family protein [Phycisphaerae bacterium]|nr:MAG: recombinase family protein [Planctomycetota bacterium]MBE7456095.1 recombinase family protein [Planctomycetia bacterium]MCL4718601.1 recombinase family protein [Phycisphaerae bacterium]
MKRFVALARVSSREQEREGFSLAVQEDALRRYAATAGGEIVRFFRIAETASKSDERKTYRELIAYAKKNAEELDALLFYKVDRAARNLFDYVELERLESEYGLAFVSVSQPTENNPAGRMMRRTLANMASFYTEQQSVDVREGLARRVQEGWFVGKAPYGYRNVRRDGRCVTEVDPAAAENVKRIFHLYAYEPLTLDGLRDRLHAEGMEYRPDAPRFTRSKLHAMLTDRGYIGEIPFKGQWYPGKQKPLIDRATWDRAQALMGGHVYHAHQMTFAGEFMVCGHCGRAVTGEQVIKRSKSGERRYVYYRCSGYTAPGHPRVRVPEPELDRQVLELFGRMKVEDPEVRDWFRMVLASQTRDAQKDSRAQREELLRQSSLLVAQQDRLLNLRIADDVDQETFARKHTELRDRLSSIKLQLDVLDRSHDETAELAAKVFELSQTLQNTWVSADYATKRRILEIVCLDCRLDGATLCPATRKPFDVLVEGLDLSKSRGDWI